MRTQIIATTHHLAAGRQRHRLRTPPAAAAIAYTMAWVAGLAIWPSNLDVAASGTQVIAGYTGHQGVAMAQYILVEGLAGAALAVVARALGQAGRRRGAGLCGILVHVAGMSAAIVSLAQCALGLVLAGRIVPDDNAGAAGMVFGLINRGDGVKMFLLAAMAIGGVGVVRRAGVLPRWVGYIGVALAMALLVSGVGYLLLSNTLALAAAASLPLLLVFVSGSGLILAGTTR